MEIILVLGALWLGSVLWKWISNIGRGNQQPTQSRTGSQQRDTRSETRQRQQRKAANLEVYRPTARSNTSSSINFKTTTSGSAGGAAPAKADLEGLHDAFTGAPLNKALGLHQCQSCKVYYHTESLQVLREANSSQCVSCQSTNIIAVIAGGRSTGGKDYKPNVVTLENYKDHEGSVVTFEGRVHRVNESRRGNDFAVMFEDKSWIRGFKLVFFRDAVRKVGGKPYISGLQGKTVSVRGLVINHPRFGYEIVVSEKSMILSAK